MSTTADADSTARVVLEGQLREAYGRVVYSHKTHEKCADLLLSRLSTVKFWQIALSALTAVGFLSVVFGVGKPAAIIGTAVSAILLALNTYTKDYDLGELAEKHRQTAADLWLIRERYLSLLTDLRSGTKSLPEAESSRDELLTSLHALYSSAPSTTHKAYTQAQKALKYDEDMTFSDQEIDALLPAELRRPLAGEEHSGTDRAALKEPQRPI